MIKKITRRMRCSYQSCHKLAAYGIGSKGIDYPLCEEHFKSLIEDGYDILNPAPVEVPEVVIEEPAVEVIEEEKETPAPVEEKHSPDDYFVCKYCGEKFLKSEVSVAQFAAHVKQCKKERGK